MSEKTVNSYLLRQYGITLVERTAIIAEQGGKCICGRLLDETCRLEVDHEHIAVKDVQATRAKNSVFDQIGLKSNGWYASTALLRTPVWAKVKAEAVRLALKAGRRASVRGVLCGGRYAGCNRKLGRLDDPVWLAAARDYVADPPARRVLKQA
jgi:hypothetical protein